MTDPPARPGTEPEGGSPPERKKGEADATEADATEAEEAVVAENESASDAAACELCGAPVVERHCKIVCTNCGYTRDCSDP